MTREEYKIFHAERVAEGAKIDPQNCELLRTFILDPDPYGVLGVSSYDEGVMIGSHWFVRALPDGKWIDEFDLPEATYEALQARKLRGSDVAWDTTPAPGKEDEFEIPFRKEKTMTHDFKADIDIFIADFETWMSAIHHEPGPKHIDQLKDRIAAIVGIEHHIADAGPEHADQLKRAFNVRSNLGTLLRRAEGTLTNTEGMNAALAAVMQALDPLSDDEKRGVLTVVMAQMVQPPGRFN